MGTPELHLNAIGPVRRFAVAGESMEFLLRTGDVLYAARGGGPARAGDVVLTMGKDAPVLAHRVFLAAWGILLTKGDFHLLPDGPAAPAALVGRVLAAERGEERVWLGCGWARAAGFGAAACSLAGVLLYRCAQLLLWLAGGLALRLGWDRLQRRLEIAHLTFVRALLRRPAEALFRALARHTRRRHGVEVDAVLRGLAAGKDAAGGIGSSAGTGRTDFPTAGAAVWAAGEVSRDTEWSGEVRVLGDVVVLPGAVLTIRPGTRVLFLAGKRFHHGVRRRRGGRSCPLTDASASHLVVYGGLRVLGEASAPVFFEGAPGPWGGILLLGEGGHELRHAELAVSRLGLLCADGAGLEAADLRFIGTRDCAVRCAGGAQARLERCRFEGGREGICVEEGARASLSGASFRGVGAAVLARGAAEVRLESCRADGLGAAGSRGFVFEDGARGEAKDCEAVGCAIGQVLQGRARLSLLESRFLKNGTGLACVDESAAGAVGTTFADNAEANVSLTGGEHRLEGCSLRGSAAGLRVSGRARLELAGGSIRGSSGEGLALVGEAGARVQAAAFSGNKTAIAVSGGARLSGEGLRVEDGAGHGLWLKESASAELSGGVFSRNQDNGIYLTGSARLALSGGELAGNRCGLACADESRACAEKASFAENAETNVSLTGGEHRLSGCALRGAPAGVSVVGRARLELADCSLRESREAGLALADESQTTARGGSFAGNRTGITLCGRAGFSAEGLSVEASFGHGMWLTGDSSASLQGGVLSGSGDNGIYLTGKARLELSGGELKGNRCGLACAGESAASAVKTTFSENTETNVSLTGGRHRLEGCSLQGSALGLGLVGKAKLELAGGSVCGSGGAGLSLADEAEGQSKDAGFSGNRTGIALCGRARLRAEAARVEKNLGHGLWLQESSAAALKDGRLCGNADNGAYLTGSSRLELSGGALQGNRCGLACADESSAGAVKTVFADNAHTNVSLTGGAHRLEECCLQGSALGLGLVGKAKLELAGGSVCGSGGDGLSLADEAEARAKGAAFSGNRTGIALCGGARLWTEAVRVEKNLGHGLWLKDAAAAAFAGGGACGNGDNGIYLTGSARLDLSDGELKGNRCGLSGADASAASAVQTTFADNLDSNVSLTGGDHRFSDCALRGAAAGLGAAGGAKVELTGCSIRDSAGKGLALGDEARVKLDAVACEGNATGIELSGRSNLNARSARVGGSAGHGLWLQDESSAELSGGDFSRNGDNGVYLTGRARLALSGGGLEGNRCGLACADESAASAAGSRFARSAEVGICLSGGKHRLADCAVSDCPLGLSVQGGAQVEARSLRLAGNGSAVVLSGKTQSRFDACAWRDNAVGLWAQEDSGCSIQGGVLRRHREQALRAGQRASLSARGARFLANQMALLLEDEARAAMEACAFRGNPTGAKADGRSRLALKGCRLRRCATDGAWLGAQASGDISGCAFTANRVAIHHHLDAHINLAHNEFRANVYSDVCCYSKCHCPPAGVPGEEEACLKA